MRAKPFLVAALLAAIALPALAQAPQGTPTNVRGRIAKLSDHSLAVKEAGGKTVTVMLAPDTAVRALVRKKFSDIKTGDNVASTSMRGKDGKLHAIEVHFLPPVVPESQFPYDLRPGSVMTNAHVSGVATAKRGGVLTVTFKGQTAEVIVDAKTTIVGAVPASMSDLKPGKAVFLRALKHPDGSISANNVTVEKNGIKPPM
jgi:hypothetical protein